MANFLIEALNSMLPTPNPDIRAACLELLEIEIERAENEVFGTGQSFVPPSSYLQSFKIAKAKHALALERQFLSHETLHLQTFWLDLLGYRLCAENDLLYGGIRATQIRAAEVLGISPLETREWDSEALFDVYVNTALRHEWKYDGSHFRYQNR